MAYTDRRDQRRWKKRWRAANPEKVKAARDRYEQKRAAKRHPDLQRGEAQ